MTVSGPAWLVALVTVVVGVPVAACIIVGAAMLLELRRSLRRRP